MRSYSHPLRWMLLPIAISGACSCAAEPEPRTTEATVPATSTVSTGSAPPAEPAEPIPTEAFAAISEESVAEETAVEFQAILDDMAGKFGVTATVMSPEGTWSGAAGTADGARPMKAHDQFSIASITKPIIAAQVMQLVEAGELSLDNPAADYLPTDLDFDSNGATIRQLLSHHSGIPDWYDNAFRRELAAEPRRAWRLDEVLKRVRDHRTPAGETFEYADTNYNLLGLIIEQVRGRPLVEILRDGVLGIDHIPRLIYQPHDAPSEPIAMPYAEPAIALEARGGYLPSLADATSAGAGGAMASDAPSLAHWWRGFCAGEIVSQRSLTQMATYQDDYGLGLFEVSDPYYPGGVGHAGESLGYASWAGCLPDSGVVIVILSNHKVDDLGGMAAPLVYAATQD